MFGNKKPFPDNPKAPPQPYEFSDATTLGVPARGRGSSTLNPGNRYETVRLHVLGEHIESQFEEHPDGIQVTTQPIEEHARTIINHVADSPDIPFAWSINPYRGCEHGCIYCYARPTHEQLGMSLGLDFETKIMVKKNAAELLRRELASPKWKGEPIVFSGVTDCYQPLEARTKLTRSLMEICADCRQPVSIITKNHLVTRDIDVFKQMAEHNAVRIFISVTTLDPKLAITMEPRASSPKNRLRAVRELNAAGIPVGVMVAPIIPGLNDVEVPAILEAVAEAGARSAGWTMLRLPYQIKDLFIDWLKRNYPERADRVEHLIRNVRGGNLNSSKFGQRMRGEGEQAEVIKKMFIMYRKKFRLDRDKTTLSSAAFRRPMLDGQLPLFGG